VERDLLLPERLAPLVRNTIFFGNIHHCLQTESTNAQAARAAAAGRDHDSASEGEVFLAEEQTAGRGRGQHAWHSERGSGIYCSVLLRPRIRPSDSLWLSLISAVAVQDAVREVVGIKADIRWPNDLLLSDRKFCGILTELNSDSTRVNHVVVGIGINVNHTDFPPELSDIATSLARECGGEVSRLDLTAAVLKCMDREYRALLGAIDSPFHTPELRFGEIVKRVESRSSYAYGRHVRVEEEGGYVGITDGLDSRGFLRVQTDHGLRMVISGSVRPVRRSTDAAGH